VLLLLTLRTQRQQRDPALAVYRQFCRKLARAGLTRQDAEGPIDFAARLTHARPELAAAAHAITRLYVALRYEKFHQNKHLRELRHRVRQFSV